MPQIGPQTSQTLAGGILAGGAGRRFGGVDKGWLDHRGRSFVERVLGRLSPQVDLLLISANRHLDRYAALGHPVLADRLGAGPLAGLLRLLETADVGHEWLLAAPCDALDLPRDLGAQMRARQRQTGADVVVLRDDDGEHPTVSLTRCALWRDLEAFLQSGGRAGRAWQARQSRAYLERPGCLVNVNDRDALAALEARATPETEPAHG